MSGKLKERLHFFQQMEEVLREMNREEVVDCSEATVQCMKHILRELRVCLYRLERTKIEHLKAKGKLSPKEAVHRKALLRKRWR